MRRWVGGFLALGLSLPVHAHAQDRAGAHVALAQQLMRKGRDKDATLELRAALAIDPQREDARALLAGLDGSVALSATAGTAPAGVSAGEAGLTERVEGALERARNAYQDSDLKASAASYHEALQLQPESVEARQGLARLEDEAYQRDKDQPFDQAVAELYEQGLRQMRKGRLVEARKKLDEARALNPMQPQLLKALDRIAQGAAQQQSQQDAQSLVLEGQRWMADGEDAKAAASFSQALQASPGLQAAQAGLDRLRERNRNKVAVALAQGRKASAAQDWDAADKAYGLALSLDPAQAEAKQGLAQAHAQRQGRLSAAEQRREADRLYNAGVEAWQAGDLASAAARFRETLAVAPGDPEATRSLEVLRKKLEQRADKDHQDAIDLLAEGRTLEQRGALDEALRRYERALGKDPALASAQSAKDSLEKRIKGL